MRETSVTEKREVEEAEERQRENERKKDREKVCVGVRGEDHRRGIG